MPDVPLHQKLATVIGDILLPSVEIASPEDQTAYWEFIKAMGNDVEDSLNAAFQTGVLKPTKI